MISDDLAEACWLRRSWISWIFRGGDFLPWAVWIKHCQNLWHADNIAASNAKNVSISLWKAAKWDGHNVWKLETTLILFYSHSIGINDMAYGDSGVPCARLQALQMRAADQCMLGQSSCSASTRQWRIFKFRLPRRISKMGPQSPISPYMAWKWVHLLLFRSCGPIVKPALPDYYYLTLVTGDWWISRILWMHRLGINLRTTYKAIA